VAPPWPTISNVCPEKATLEEEVTRVELFENIRRDYFLHAKSINAIAREWHVHKRTVRAALDNAVPATRKQPERTSTVLTPTFRAIIKGWLEADREAPRKQRHTARRIFDRLVREHDFPGAESTVRQCVREMRRGIALVREAFVPRDHAPGEEAEVDFYEAMLDLPMGRTKAYCFEMRACFSGRAFHMAFPALTQQALLEAHVAAFAHFGAVFQVIRYDNLKPAVSKVLQGRRREETERFVAMRSHYLFESEYCLPGIDGAHEKGGVEGEGGRFRRMHLVPVPTFSDFDAFNRYLLDCCREDDQRRMAGRQARVADDWAAELPYLLPLPANPYDAAKPTVVRVDSMGRVCVATNRYSVPIRLVGKRVEVRLGATSLEIFADGQSVAVHERLNLRNAERLVLDHYLDLLRHKPGALRRSRALRQARDRKEWPPEYDQLWTALKRNYGDQDGTRQMIDVLLLHRDASQDIVDTAVGLALAYGTCDAGAVAALVRQLQISDRKHAPLTGVDHLSTHDRPAATDLSQYDLLAWSAS